MCWPCRVVKDSIDLIALFIAAGSRYKANPKRTASDKRAQPDPPLPRDEFTWRADTLRLMIPGRAHSVWLFWNSSTDTREFDRFFVNMEEPVRRTAIGFDTQDHTLDIDIKPDLSWAWRDEEELKNHVSEGFFSEELADAAHDEGLRVIDEVSDGTHPCVTGWPNWKPERDWLIPEVSPEWSAAAPTFWARRSWAYGVSGDS